MECEGPLLLIQLSHSFLSVLCIGFLSFRYECFKQENTISLFPIALLLIFSVSVTVVSTHFHYNSNHLL